MVDWLGLAVPFAYLGILVGSLATFSSLYRKRKSVNASSLEPWFPPHLQRNIYLSLLHLEPEVGDKKSPAVPESVLRAALLRRATEDIRRVLAVRNAKQALTTLLQKGSVGDELWQRCLLAEKEIEEEVRDVVTEANAFSPNWGQSIFQSANEMMNHAIIRSRIEEVQAQAKVEREWWDKKRARIESDFMKELDGSPAVAKPTTSGEKVGSDEDAVIVEGGGPAVVGKGSTRKKKGKK